MLWVVDGLLQLELVRVRVTEKVSANGALVAVQKCLENACPVLEAVNARNVSNQPHSLPCTLRLVQLFAQPGQLVARISRIVDEEEVVPVTGLGVLR